ncbi:hypothetical protein DESC_310084 [Desulfosarcina cetonica]|nr:hypothetical protein DESC_310084 [Desulfosarcina cetonica]
MIEPIGEPAVRMTTRVENPVSLENKDVALQKIEKAVEERPIESTQESEQMQSESDPENGAYQMDEEGIYFEKYDKNGNVVYRVPPEQKPIDERA